MSRLLFILLIFSASAFAQTESDVSVIVDKDWKLEKATDVVTQTTVCRASTNKAQAPFSVSLEVLVPSNDSGPTQVMIKTQGLSDQVLKAYVRPSSKLFYPLLLGSVNSNTGTKTFFASPLKTQELLKIIAEKSVFDIYFGTGQEAPLARLSLKGSENILKKAASCRPSKKLTNDSFFRFITKDSEKAPVTEGSLQDLTTFSQKALELYLSQEKTETEMKQFEKNQKDLASQDQAAQKAMLLAYDKFQKIKGDYLNLQKQFDDQQTTLNSANIQLPINQSKIPTLTDAIAVAEQNFAPVRQEVARLSTELAQVQKSESEADKEVKRLISRIEKLEKDVVSLQKEAVNLIKQAREEEANAAGLEPKMIQAEREYRQYNVQIEYSHQLSSDSSYNSAKSQLRFAEMDLRSAELRLRMEESQLRSAESRLNMCESKPDQNCSSEKSAVSSAQMQVNMAESAVNRAESEIRSAESRIRSAEADVMSRVRDEESRLGSKARSLRSQYEQALDNASYCRQKSAEIQKSTLPKTKDEIVKSKAALPIAEADLVAKKQNTVSKQAELDEYKTKSQYESLKLTLSNAQQALAQTKQDILVAEKNIKELPAKINSVQKKINEIKPKMLTSEGVYLQAKGKYDVISSQLAQIDAKIKDHQNSFDQTSDELENVKLKTQGIDLYLFSK